MCLNHIFLFRDTLKMLLNALDMEPICVESANVLLISLAEDVNVMLRI